MTGARPTKVQCGAGNGESEGAPARDVLHGELPEEGAEWTAQWNAAAIQSNALMTLMARYRTTYGADRNSLAEDSHRVESVSYGPFKARIVLGRGAVVRVPRNMPVSVYRGTERYL